MESVVPERGHEIIVGEWDVVSGIAIRFNIIGIFDGRGVLPVPGVVGEDDMAVIGKGEIGFENALTEVVV